MPSYALLLAHDEHPCSTTEWPAEPGGPCDGWAEWFGRTPLLFSVLLGDAQHLPELVPCSAYQDKENLSALAAPMEQVKARWQWLKAQMQPLPVQWPESLKKQWQAMDATITQSTRQWLLLDCATLCPHDFDEPEFIAFLNAQRDQCLLWDCSATSLPESLQVLKQNPESEYGWWSPAVIARTEVIARDEEDHWPAWLKDHYVERYHGAWDDAVDTYYVMPKIHPRTGAKLPGENDRDDWPVGMVTPYGRWLLKPLEGASMAYASGGYISVRYPEAAPSDGAPSGLKDLNGVWVLPRSAGYRDSYAVTPHVLVCKNPHVDHREDLRSLPGLELLHEAVFHVEYNPEGDGVLRASAGDHQFPQALMLNTHGQPLFDSDRYERVNAFHAKTGLAVATIRVPTTDAQGEPYSQTYEGVLHISGQEIVPCEFELIERGFNDSPPKVFPGSKLLAFTHQGQPRIYNTKGKLLAAPDIWCPPLHRDVKKNELLTFMGEGPEAEMGMFSIKDYSFTRTGETWDDYRNALRGAFKGLSGEPTATTTMTRDALIEAEDEVWMQDIARMLCLGDGAEAGELLQDWRHCVAAPDPDDMGWDEDDEIDPSEMYLPEGENALTLYWVHLLPIATHFARFDWKDANGIADTHWLPGTDDWHWDAPEDGVETGLEHMAEHLHHHGYALIRLATDDDSIRITVVRTEDAEDFLERLAQAAVRAFVQEV